MVKKTIKPLFKPSKLCTPAYIYFIISMISLTMILVQNMFGNCQEYSLGPYSCEVPSIMGMFIGKFIYIIFWTYILNLICKDNNKPLAWLLVLVPYILLFVLIGAIMVN